MKTKLSKGTTGFFNDRNEWICTGSQMGRREMLPENTGEPIKLYLQRLNLTDGGYDGGGAYWGSGKTLYMAFVGHKCHSPGLPGFELIPGVVQIFTRANSRAEAKQIVRQKLPGAKFHS